MHSFCRTMTCKRGISRHPSRSCIVSKWINISSNFFSPSGCHTILAFSVPNVMAIFRREPPNGDVECRWGRLKSRSQRISGLAINNCCIEVCISHFADGFLFTAGIGIRQCCILLHLLDGYTALPRGMHSSLKREQEALKISTSSYSLWHQQFRRKTCSVEETICIPRT